MSRNNNHTNNSNVINELANNLCGANSIDNITPEQANVLLGLMKNLSKQLKETAFNRTVHYNDGHTLRGDIFFYHEYDLNDDDFNIYDDFDDQMLHKDYCISSRSELHDTDEYPDFDKDMDLENHPDLHYLDGASYFNIDFAIAELEKKTTIANKLLSDMKEAKEAGAKYIVNCDPESWDEDE